MNAQTIITPSGERLIVLSEADYKSLVEAAEEFADGEAHRTFRQRLAAGHEELVPAGIVNRILDGENPIRVWREHRGLPAVRLAELSGITQPFLSQLETGKREGTIDTSRKLATALNITIDDLVG